MCGFKTTFELFPPIILIGSTKTLSQCEFIQALSILITICMEDHELDHSMQQSKPKRNSRLLFYFLNSNTHTP